MRDETKQQTWDFLTNSQVRRRDDGGYNENQLWIVRRSKHHNGIDI